MTVRYERMPSRIHTYSGLFVDPLDLQPEDVRIEDIAHALSNQCRFSGHTSEFFSVAQHCVLASRLVVPSYLSFPALMHDASETYLQDMAKPLKHHPTLGRAYRSAERRAETVIGQVFRVTFPPLPAVKEVDNRLCVTEARDLMHGTDQWETHKDVEPYDFTITPWSPRRSRREFLATYRRLRP